MRPALPLTVANAAVILTAAFVASSPATPATLAAAPRPTAAPAATPAAGPAVAAPPSPVPVDASPRPVQAAPRRATMRTAYRPYARVGPVVLHFPGEVVEVVGLHESGNDGAQPQDPLQRERIGRLPSRSRDTNGQGAADVVVDPVRPLRSPVTGTVVRAGTYTLYCDHVDEYLVVEPDARPGWEVKMLHFEGLRVAKGDRVQAGVTVVGAHARLLPFASQVDEHTVAPHWPHVHVEVVDPSVPDRPSGATCD